MRPWGLLAAASVGLLSPGFARQDPAVCGTHPLKLQEEMFLHRQAARKRAASHSAVMPRAVPVTQDMGNIAVLDTGAGILIARNQFNIDSRTLTFLPAAANSASYTYQLSNGSYDADAAAAGNPLTLGDDDTAAVNLPFSFPFFGAVYQQVFVNSDGNLTFTAGDSASTDRSIGRLVGGPPRISPLLSDLDPSQAGTLGGVRVLADPARFVVSWDHVPAYAISGIGPRQTFQVRLYPDGHFEFAYNGISIDSAVVGIGPGALRGSNAVLDFLTDTSATYSGLVAERFSNTVDLDLEAAAQQFYQTHDDAYDYLVFYNDMSIPAATGAVSWESTVRNNRSGYGDVPVDMGAAFGSASRLQAILNMGSLAQFPVDPKARVPARASTGDTPITILGHESGHLFLAYASILDPSDPAARPMLGYQNAHWVFNFNSDASLLEGNRIQDGGAGQSPEFTTVGTVEGYSPLDQYLMGFIPPAAVEPGYPFGLYLVTGVPAYFHTLLPQVGVFFNGSRRDVHMDELIQAVGRRTPDDTVSQRHFRWAFVLLVPAGAQPPAAELAQIDTYRTNFEAFYQQATGNHAFADTALRRSLRLSTFPASGVVAGSSATATVAVDTPPTAPLTVALAAPNGIASVPASVTIAAGARSASFKLSALRTGVEDLSATPNDPRYDTAWSRIQVAPTSALQVAVLSGDRQPITAAGTLGQPVVLQVTDINRLPYPGVAVEAAASTGGSVTPATAVTDDSGKASFRWTPGTGAGPRLRVSIQGAADAAPAVVSSGILAAGVLNAASLVQSAAPGMLAVIYGFNLGAPDTQVMAAGRSLPVMAVEDTRIQFYIPADVPVGPASLTITNSSGSSAPVAFTVAPVAPGIFYDYASGFAQGLTQPVAAGDFIQIFATGLGAHPDQVQVTIGGLPAPVEYSGGAPGLLGINQVNAQVPPALASGTQPLSFQIGGVTSNEVKIGVK
jgi:uncharacterized protein (TIGR03437 family)